MFKVFLGYGIIIRLRLIEVLIHAIQGMFPLKAFYWGQKGARENFSLQIRNIVEAAYKSLGETPVIMGECGIPMDMKYV